MKTAGIVAEYNPFHTGHAYQISETRRILGDDTAIIAVMSGNWVQQADCAIADKWTRAHLALLGGADLVLELPTLWAASTAETFARGAIELLNAAGAVDYLSFGSECGDTRALEEIARCLDTPAYHAQVQSKKDEGLTFAACRQAAVGSILGDACASLLSRPNNNLGIEYIRSLNALNSSIRPMTVLRQGADHNSVVGLLGNTVNGAPTALPRFLSATQIRLNLLENSDPVQIEPYMIPDGLKLLKERMVELPRLKEIERAMLARVRLMTAEDWANLPDSGQSEGLPRRLEQAGRQCTSMEQFFELSKTKRFTHARLRRLVLWGYLGLTESDRPSTPPYLRVLGFNNRGQNLLKAIKQNGQLPLLTKPAHIKSLHDTAQRVFSLESRCTDLYDLCFSTIQSPGREWTTGPVVLK